jgi:pimeloyl-ACP methyl ester carboxylesterase
LPQPQRAAILKRIHIISAGSPTLHDDRSGFLSPGRLEALTLPVFLMEGIASPPVADAINGALADRLPNATRMRIEGADHMGPVTHPAEVAAAIRSFL